MIRYTPETKIIRKAFWPWDKDETETVDQWIVEMHYTEFDGRSYIFTSKSNTEAAAKNVFDSIMKQIVDQDSQYANKLLEDAIINGGSK
jgi:hypothetical protein